jgi:outer membrane lipoprotein carrier protein
MSLLAAIALALIPSLAAVPAPAPAATGTSADAVRGLQGWLDGTRTLQARFQQSLVSGALGAGATESGRLYLRRPGRMRWEYAAPDPKVAVLDGERTSLYLPQDREMVTGRLSPEDSPLPALLAGQGRLDSLFRAEVLAPAIPGEIRLRLVPLAHTEGVEAVTLLLRASDHAVTGAEVRDGAGNLMAYRFSEVKRNRDVPESLFRFTPPKGTRIVDRG